MIARVWFAAPSALRVTTRCHNLRSLTSPASARGLRNPDCHSKWALHGTFIGRLITAAILTGNAIQTALRPHRAINKPVAGQDSRPAAVKNPKASNPMADLRCKTLMTAAANLKQSPDTFSEMVLSNTLQEAAKLQLGRDTNEPIIAAVVDRMNKASSRFDQQDLSNILSAASALEEAETLVDAVLLVTTQRLQEQPSAFTIESLSAILDCCATHNRSDLFLFRMVLQEVEQRRSHLTSDDVQKGLAGILWALRQFNQVPHGLLQVISELLTPKAVRDLDKQALFHLVWSYKTLQAEDRCRYQTTLNRMYEEMASSS